jgi:hypothetical protein
VSLKVHAAKYPTDTTKDTVEWKSVFHFVQATFPALTVLRMVDSKTHTPGMDKLYFSSRRTTEAIAKLVDKPNDAELFPETIPSVQEFDALVEEEADLSDQ